MAPEQVEPGQDRHDGGDGGGGQRFVAAGVKADLVLFQDGNRDALAFQFGLGVRFRAGSVAVAHHRDAHEGQGNEQLQDRGKFGLQAIFDGLEDQLTARRMPAGRDAR